MSLRPSRKRIYLDCTFTYQRGHNTGIPRVVRNLLKHAPSACEELGIEVIPIVFVHGRYFSIPDIFDPRLKNKTDSFFERRIVRKGFKLATVGAVTAIDSAYRKHLENRPLSKNKAPTIAGKESAARVRTFPAPSQEISKHPSRIKFQQGDIVFLPDFCTDPRVWFLHQRMQKDNVIFIPLIHDVIPLTHRGIYGEENSKSFATWLTRIFLVSKAAVCTTHYCKTTLLAQLEELRIQHNKEAIRVATLGYDFTSSTAKPAAPHTGLQSLADPKAPSFICVGTIEPRKNLGLLVDAFEKYVQRGGSGQLILIGRKGWMCDKFIERLTQHPLFATRLHWFNDIDDDNLAWSYRNASALIFPSLVEGFGLPLVEALSHGTPVIASDIEVFREIAEGHVHFFPPTDALSLAQLMLLIENSAISASPNTAKGFCWINWETAATRIFREVVELADRES